MLDIYTQKSILKFKSIDPPATIISNYIELTYFSVESIESLQNNNFTVSKINGKPFPENALFLSTVDDLTIQGNQNSSNRNIHFKVIEEHYDGSDIKEVIIAAWVYSSAKQRVINIDIFNYLRFFNHALKFLKRFDS